MSDIPSIGPASVAAVNRGTRIASTAPVAGVSGANRDPDQADLSVKARMLSRLSELPQVREGLIARVRTEIEAGTYDSPDKIEALLDSLAEDLA